MSRPAGRAPSNWISIDVHNRYRYQLTATGVMPREDDLTGEVNKGSIIRMLLSLERYVHFRGDLPSPLSRMMPQAIRSPASPAGWLL
jgi:hypothetical protein